MDKKIRITSDDYIKYAALGISKGFISFQPLAKQRIHGNNAYTGKKEVGTLRGLIQVLTAANLKEKFPELSKYIAEMPVTIPDEKNPEITLKNLKSYLDSLNSMFNKYELEHS